MLFKVNNKMQKKSIFLSTDFTNNAQIYFRKNNSHHAEGKLVVVDDNNRHPGNYDELLQVNHL